MAVARRSPEEAKRSTGRSDWSTWPAYDCPVLFAWGMHDAFLTPDYPLMLASMIEHGQLYVMDKASHHLQEERPQHFHSVVSGFLDQADRPGVTDAS